MIKRLRTKFVCINMALVMTVLAAVLVLVYHSTAKNLEASSVAALKAASQSHFAPGRPGAGNSHLTFSFEEQPDGAIMVFGGGFFDLSDEEMISDIYRLAEAEPDRFGVLQDYALRFCREEGKLGDRYVFIDISAELAALQNLLITCLMIGLCGFAGFLAISILLARWAIRPVEQAWQQQRQFVADASHELKTPLTVILTNAEMLQSPEFPPEQKQQFAESILSVSRQMRVLVEGLLQLARADRGLQKPEMADLDLSALVEEAVLPFEPLYFERGLMLESAVEPGIHVQGEKTTLLQAINVLLDNGQKYAAPDGKASLTLTRQGKKAVLRFFTPGEPLTQAQCSHIFKRFARLDEARTHSGSYGLGLSIAQNIVNSHGGRIWAEGKADGNLFVIQIPES